MKQALDVFEGKHVVDTDDYSDKEAFEAMGLLKDDGSYPPLKIGTVNYLPGVIANVYPEGIGGFKTNKKGAVFFKDIHYGPSPSTTSDQSKVNIFFAEKAPERPTKDLQLGTLGVSEVVPPLIIPPDTVMRVSTRLQLPQGHDISLLTVNPHMHLLGESFKGYALTPTGDTIRLVNIPKWDFRWQYFYTYEKPVVIPGGSTIVAEGVYDNTSNNPNNPYDPPQTIREQDGSMRTTDEMFQFILTYVPYQSGDEHIDLTAAKGQLLK